MSLLLIARDTAALIAARGYARGRDLAAAVDLAAASA
jgi:hypothetical protein